ncbi:MAG: nucleotidyltransferase family protein [Planctomycetota bacterium]
MALELDYDPARLAEICRRYRVAKLELFGSRARGTARPDSDVDVLVTFEPGVDLGLLYFGLGPELEALLGRPVDMVERPVVERDRNPYFREQVLAVTEVLYAA